MNCIPPTENIDNDDYYSLSFNNSFADYDLSRLSCIYDDNKQSYQNKAPRPELYFEEDSFGSTFFRYVPDDDKTETEVNFRSNPLLLPCPEEKCRHVRFGPMTVREYEVVCMPDHKESCCLLSLGWEHSPDTIYESTPERTRSKARRLTFSQRRNRLAVVQGWTTAQKQLQIEESSEELMCPSPPRDTAQGDDSTDRRSMLLRRTVDHARVA